MAAEVAGRPGGGVEESKAAFPSVTSAHTTGAPDPTGRGPSPIVSTLEASKPPVGAGVQPGAVPETGEVIALPPRPGAADSTGGSSTGSGAGGGMGAGGTPSRALLKDRTGSAAAMTPKPSFVKSLKSAFSMGGAAPARNVGKNQRFRAARLHGPVQVREDSGMFGRVQWKAKYLRLEGTSLRVYDKAKHYVEASHELTGALATDTIDPGHVSFTITLKGGTLFHLRVTARADRVDWVAAINEAAAGIAPDMTSPRSSDVCVRIESASEIQLPELPPGAMEPWHCALCTSSNPPERTHCRVCGRDQDYVPKSGPGACNHDFAKHTRMKAMSYYPCAVCNQPISGMLGKCLKCLHCGLMIHKPCLVDAQTSSHAAQSGVFAVYSKSFRISSNRALPPGVRSSATTAARTSGGRLATTREAPFLAHKASASRSALSPRLRDKPRSQLGPITDADDAVASLVGAAAAGAGLDAWELGATAVITPTAGGPAESLTPSASTAARRAAAGAGASAGVGVGVGAGAGAGAGAGTGASGASSGSGGARGAKPAAAAAAGSSGAAASAAPAVTAEST